MVQVDTQLVLVELCAIKFEHFLKHRANPLLLRQIVFANDCDDHD